MVGIGNFNRTFSLSCYDERVTQNLALIQVRSNSKGYPQLLRQVVRSPGLPLTHAKSDKIFPVPRGGWPFLPSWLPG